MSGQDYMCTWRRVPSSHPCKSLSALKTNGSNRGLKRDRGTDYTMDEMAAYSQDYDQESRLIMQGARVTADYKTRRHLIMAVKMVYQIQSEEENWSHWGDVIKNTYHKVSAKSYYNIAERMTQNLFQTPLEWNMYTVFTMVDFKKFESFYTEQEWKTLLFNLNVIHKYYVENKHIPKTMDKKFEFYVKLPSTFG